MNRVNCQVTFHITGILNPLRPKGLGKGVWRGLTGWGNGIKGVGGGDKGVGEWD